MSVARRRRKNDLAATPSRTSPRNHSSDGPTTHHSPPPPSPLPPRELTPHLEAWAWTDGGVPGGFLARKYRARDASSSDDDDDETTMMYALVGVNPYTGHAVEIHSARVDDARLQRAFVEMGADECEAAFALGDSAAALRAAWDARGGVMHNALGLPDLLVVKARDRRGYNRRPLQPARPARHSDTSPLPGREWKEPRNSRGATAGSRWCLARDLSRDGWVAQPILAILRAA